ncbi:cadherin domain-containing protein [Phormidium sp. CCY1219]|uniref:cadherin domain-containing protein n=1 Tax=Phormidium sp. CCY1219 TaxID=2886104 RepID=UPI002D1E976C|nr:cadherin domain-containing protein [Phormidium sp. CCY1219]MEB3831894.1 cadherin domain-containing protein [Phormidium sp. CCY1219]
MSTNTVTLEVGKLNTANLTNEGFETVNLSSTFSQTPVVFSQVQTYNGVEFVRTRQNNASSTGFNLAMEEEEALQNGHATETVGWLALEPGQGNWNGHLFQAGATATSVNDSFSGITFDSDFATAPQFMAAMATYNGIDPAGVRYRNLGMDTVEVKIEEEQSQDTETSHANEQVNFLALEGEGVLSDVNGTVIGEFGQIDNLDHNSQTINLLNSYSNPVIFMPTLSYYGADPSTTRITNVGSNNFTAFLEEAEYKDGSHTTENASYFVFEAGSWELSITGELVGVTTDDLLVGDVEDDIISGNEGDDVIVGKEGSDVLSGDAGSDYFVFGGLAEGVDTIQDFNAAQGDRIVIAPAFEEATSVEQFAFDSLTGVLSFNGTDLAQLQGVTSVDLLESLIFSVGLGVEENSANGTVVGTVAISNPASSNPYQITGGNENGIFAIDVFTGEITVADRTQLDRETQSLHYLFVEAIDATGQTITKQVTINVGDVNEAPEFASNSTFSIEENPHDGVSVGTIQATDPENDALTYKIIGGNESDAFTIDELTGEITIANGEKLDYETQNSYNLTVKAIDEGKQTTETTVAIDVMDGNEAPIIETDDDETFIFHENNNNGTIVAQVPAFDENVGQQAPIYSIVGGTGQNYFGITPDGNIVIEDSVGLRSNNATDYNLTVRVADSFNSSLTDEVTVILEKSKFTNVIKQEGSESPFSPIDTGSNSDPTFADIDRDGDMDAFVGRLDGTVAYFRNDNGSFVPSQTQNPLKNVNFEEDVGASPTFADIDNDGDLDAIVGNFNAIHYYQNDNGHFVEKTDSANPLSDINGFNPQFADMDEDGDLDAFVSSGKDSSYSVNYYRNDSGTFTQDNNNNPLNNQNFLVPAATFADIDDDGDLDAVVGVKDGTIQYFQNDGGTFNKKTGSDNPFNSIDVGNYADPSFADVNDDGYLDLIVGSEDGTLSYYEGTPSVFNLNFSSTGQSVWDSGTSQLEWNWSPLQDLIGTDKISWDISPSVDFDLGELGADTHGGIGLSAGYELDAGTIDTELPVDIWLNIPEAISSGETITISSGFSLGDKATFDTTTPRVAAYLDFLFEIYAGAYVTLDYKIGEYTKDYSQIDINESFNFQFDSTGQAVSFEEIDSDDFSVDLGSLGSLGYETGGWGDIHGYVPDISIEGDRINSNTLSGSKSDVVLDASLDLDKVFLTALSESNIPYLSKAAEALDYVIEGNLDLGVAYANWNLFDAAFESDFSLVQDLDLTVDNLTGTLNVEGQGAVPFTVGQDLQITPQDTNGDGQVDITGTVDVAPQLNSNTSIDYDLDIPLTALEGEAGYDVSVDFGLFKLSYEDSAEFGPIWSENMNLTQGGFDLYDNSFTLGGFNTATLDFSIPIA